MANFSNINNKFIVTDGGNILIGQTANDASSPKLQVAGSIMSSSSSLLAAPTTASIVIDYHSSSNAGRIMTGSGAAWNKNLALVPYGGNVGIGTVSPVGKLQVSLPTYTNEDTNSQQAIFGVDSGYGVRIGYNETDNKGYINVLKPGVAWGSLILQEDIGKVGIGTDSPQRPLHVNGTEGVARFTSTASGNNGFEVGIGVSSQAFLWLAENSHMEFATNNIERMRITSDGYIRIGNNSSNVRLAINGWSYNPGSDGSGCVGLKQTGASSYGYVVEAATNDKWMMMGHNGTNGIIETTYATSAGHSDLHIKTGSSNYLVLQSSGGKVGIGTTSPGSKLDIGTSTGASIQFLYDTSQAYRNNISNYWNSSTDSRMDFNIGRTANVAPVTVMSVGYGGNVGIGTTSPGALLDLGNSIQDNKVHLYASGNDKYGMGIRGSQFLFYSGGLGSGSGGITFGKMNGTTYTENMRVTNDGNVGIGITNPQDKLHVSGDAIISSTRFGDFATASMNTTGVVIARVAASTNGQSAIVEFVASGNNGAYYNVVYSCYNGGGAWFYSKNVVGSGGNIEVAETNGGGSSELTFKFRTTSGTASYTPRVMMKGMPYNLVTF